MSELITRTTKCSDVFEPLNQPHRWKAAHGGRGSGKSHFFAEKLVWECVDQPGTRAVCIRQFQRTLRESSLQIVVGKIQALGLEQIFHITERYIETPGDGVILFEGMQTHNAHSIKSLEGCRIAWADEAQTLTEHSLMLLRPTIRLPGSELWFSYNRTRRNDAVDMFFAKAIEAGEDAVLVEANWRHNPWWNEALDKERQTELRVYPERYEHVYEGAYASAFAGAYYAKQLAQAKLDKRICRVVRDPLLPVRAFFDLGGAGAKADAMAVWIAQFVAQEIRLLDYVEGVGQPLSYYAEQLTSRGWDKLWCFIPHDGLNTNAITGKTYHMHMSEVPGWRVDPPIENQGPGAAPQRIEAARRIFNKCWFDEERTQSGRDALGYYHQKRHEERNIGLGPEHDWSSHAADAFGLMAIVYEGPDAAARTERRRRFRAGGWQAA